MTQVDRTTNCTGAIKEMTFGGPPASATRATTSTKDDGETYPYRGMEPGRSHDSQEVFERYPDTAFIIEIKQEEPSLDRLDHFVKVIREHEFEDR